MPAGLATSDQLTAIDRLLRSSRYLYMDLSGEDLAEVVAQGMAFVIEDERQLWGFLALQVEARPATVPASFATRANLRGVGLAHGRWPSSALPLLLDAAFQRLRALPSPHQIVAYGSERWLTDALQATGFQVVEQIQFLRLDHLARRPPPAPTESAHSGAAHSGAAHSGAALIRPADAGDVDALLQLDGVAFEPLWRFGLPRLVEVLMLCRVDVAELDGELIGYSALALANPAEAHLARLAVHPAVQSRGIGRALLQHVIDRARSQGSQSLLLNTQTTNVRALHLYRAAGFHPIGHTIPVLTKPA